MTIASTLRMILPDLPDPGRAATPSRLSLALQGGGSFGAFAWGVLDALLEAGLRIDAVSGASAGAVNAVLLADGLAHGGPDRARALLERFWRHASEAASLSFSRTMTSWGPLLSPYQFNPLDISPLRQLIGAEVDFERLRERSPIRLLIGATRVSDGGLRIFREHEVTAEVVMASACLPLLSQAVEIDGEAYWDGGYSANPPLIPLVQATAVPDVMVVQIIPVAQAVLPRSSAEIARRIAQITFNASLMRDREMLDIVADIGSAALPTLFRKLDRSARLRLHLLSAEDHVDGLASASATDLDWRFVTGLRDAGRAAGRRWMEEGSARKG